jgi:tetratricopeptide (TPR) repeat protein
MPTLKFKYFLFLFTLLSLFSCTNTSNSADFIQKAKGRYLYNSDEVIDVYFKNDVMYMAWRGATDIKPLKINDSIFYVKEMNAKIKFLKNPADQLTYMALAPKEKDQPVTYNYKKLKDGEKVPSEYLKDNEFDKALTGYLAIKERDSLNPVIDEGNFNSLGYAALREKKYDEAINIFKINVALHPTSANVYDSLGDAFRKKGDTIQAIANYKKSLEFDSGNARAKRIISRLEKKE